MLRAVPCDLPDDILRSQFGCASILPRIRCDTAASIPSARTRQRQRCRSRGGTDPGTQTWASRAWVSHANSRACCCPLRHNGAGARGCTTIGCRSSGGAEFGSCASCRRSPPSRAARSAAFTRWRTSASVPLPPSQSGPRTSGEPIAGVRCDLPRRPQRPVVAVGDLRQPRFITPHAPWTIGRLGAVATSRRPTGGARD
jgi:hypothetical protein